MEAFLTLSFLILSVIIVKYFLGYGLEKLGVVFVSFIIFFIAFNSPLKSIVFLIFSMLLSPELETGYVGGRSVVIRYDDIFLIIIFISWLVRNAIKKEPFLIKTPIQLPLLIYTSVYIISTMLGIMREIVIAKKAFFYLLKYIEYYVLYFMVVNVLKDETNYYRYFKYALVVLIIVVIYSYYYYHNATGNFVRTTAPFEAPLEKPDEAEPASLGGYYLLSLSILFALISQAKGKVLIISLLMIAFIYPSFLLTFSRASYLGFIAMMMVFLFFVRERKLYFLISGFFILAFTLILPGISEKVKERIKSTYSGSEATNMVLTPFGIIRLEDSAYARYRSIENVILNVLPYRPFFGNGVTGIGLGDSQYALVLGESGIIGFLAFIWLLYSIIDMSYKVYLKANDILERSVAFGVFSSVFAFLVQGTGVNTFIIVRIMEPFWFCVAIVSLSYLKIERNNYAHR